MNRGLGMIGEEFEMSERLTQLTHFEMKLQGVQPRTHGATTLAWRTVKVAEEVAEVFDVWTDLEAMDGQARMTRPEIHSAIARLCSELLDVMLCGMQATINVDPVQALFEQLLSVAPTCGKNTSEKLNAFRNALRPEVTALVLLQGQAAQSVIGYTGQNPRKGRTHTNHDVNMTFYRLVHHAWWILGRLNHDPVQAFNAKIAARRASA